MKIKIVKKYEWPSRPGRFWEPGEVAQVTNDFGRDLIKDGYARELRIEKRRDKKGIEFEVVVEVVDKSASIIHKAEKTKEKE